MKPLIKLKCIKQSLFCIQLIEIKHVFELKFKISLGYNFELAVSDFIAE